MRLSKIWLICLLVFAAAASSGAQTAPSSRIGQNYYDCLNGRYGCDTGVLSATEQPAVAEAAHKRNYYDCLNGRYGCNTGALTATEQAAVAEAAHKRNYYDCLNGRYGCNAGALTTTEQPAVA